MWIAKSLRARFAQLCVNRCCVARGRIEQQQLPAHYAFILTISAFWWAESQQNRILSLRPCLTTQGNHYLFPAELAAWEASLAWKPLMNVARVLCHPTAWTQNHYRISSGHQGLTFWLSFQIGSVVTWTSGKGNPSACLNIPIPHQRSRLTNKIGCLHLSSYLQLLGCAGTSSQFMIPPLAFCNSNLSGLWLRHWLPLSESKKPSRTLQFSLPHFRMEGEHQRDVASTGQELGPIQSFDALDLRIWGFYRKHRGTDRSLILTGFQNM